MMNTTTTSDIRELDHRSSNGLEIMLFWSAPTNQVFVAVRDERQGTSVEIEIDPAHARDAFLHPFAYAQALDDYPLAA
jgi:hypothetical protein